MFFGSGHDGELCRRLYRLVADRQTDRQTDRDATMNLWTHVAHSCIYRERERERSDMYIYIYIYVCFKVYIHISMCVQSYDITIHISSYISYM